MQRLQPNESALTGEAMERSSADSGITFCYRCSIRPESSIGDHSGVTIEMGSRHDLSSREEVGQRQAVADEASQGNRYPRYPRVEKLSEGETISLNATDTAEWKRVPGIGTVYASRIVKYHERLGGFARKEQLLEVYGVDGELYARIAPYIEVVGVSEDWPLISWNLESCLDTPT